MMPFIKYISDGRKNPEVKISVSMNKGASWKEIILKSGQSYPIPPNVTNLLIDNIPYNSKNNYNIRNGHVAQN